MTKKHVETGTCFEYREHEFMIERDNKETITGKLYLMNAEGIPTIIGTYVWGFDPFMYVTRDVMPGTPATVAIRKRECKYLRHV